MEHKCNWDTIKWEKNYFIGGLGETLERVGKCAICDKTFREVYLHSCILEDNTSELADLTVE